ncbi:MAG TPA: hypothetical protein VKO18_07325 [Terriglobia bacterium]|nr:hypothetical protein [Terriglobia bacterium]
MKRPTMTKKRVAANQANGRRSHGPATAEGCARIREANTRHGFYSQAEAVALAFLGEDPAELECLRKNLHDGLQLPSAMAKELAEHLVEVVWRWKRAGRMQEGYALRLAKDANLTREGRLHAQMMRLEFTAETLRRLAQSVAREDYVTTPANLETMKNLHQERALKDMGEIALALFYQLQVPGADESGLDPEEKARRLVAQAKEIFGIGTTAPFAPPTNAAPDSTQVQESQPVRFVDSEGVPPAPGSGEAEVTQDDNHVRYPRITAAEWEARERPRQLLKNILKRQVEICEAQRMATYPC